MAVTLAAGAAPLRAQDGTVRGVVRYQGQVPRLQQLKITTNQEVCGDSIPSRHVLVNGGKVRHAVVYLEGGSHAAPSDRSVAPVTLANRHCDFDPVVLASGTGAVLALQNADAMMHNVHMYRDRRTVGNVALPANVTAQNRRALSMPGRVEVKCDAHPWMRATIWVFDYPSYAVTDAEGGFAIAAVPPGRYVLKVWHAVLGEQSREIVVESGRDLAVELAFTGAGR